MIDAGVQTDAPTRRRGSAVGLARRRSTGTARGRDGWCNLRNGVDAPDDAVGDGGACMASLLGLRHVTMVSAAVASTTVTFGVHAPNGTAVLDGRAQRRGAWTTTPQTVTGDSTNNARRRCRRLWMAGDAIRHRRPDQAGPAPVPAALPCRPPEEVRRGRQRPPRARREGIVVHESARPAPLRRPAPEPLERRRPTSSARSPGFYRRSPRSRRRRSICV